MPYKDEERAKQYWKEYDERRKGPQRARVKAYYWAHKEECDERSRQYAEAHREELNAKAREYYYRTKAQQGVVQRESKKQYQKKYYEEHRRPKQAREYKSQKQRIFEHYGLSCACCGENNPAVLTIDHVNNDGAEHRRLLGLKGRGANMYAWLVKNNFPEGFQTLCFNCNCAKPKGACHPKTEPAMASA